MDNQSKNWKKLLAQNPANLSRFLLQKFSLNQKTFKIFPTAKNNIDSLDAKSLTPATKEIGWGEFILLLVGTVALTAGIYVVRQRLREPLPSLRYFEQSKVFNTEFTGTVVPSQEFKIAANNPAIVKNIYVKIGDRIQPNQPLLTLEDLAAKNKLEAVKQQQTAVKQEINSANQQQELAKQQVKQLEQKIQNLIRLESLNTLTQSADIDVSTAQLHFQQVPLHQRQDSIPRAQAVYEQAIAQHSRLEKLYREGAVAKAQLDRTLADLKVAQADLESAKAATKAARNLEVKQLKQWQFKHQMQLAQQQQQLAELRGQLELARLQYEQATRKLEVLRQQLSDSLSEKTTDDILLVKATDNGVVVNLPVGTGDQIFTGTNLVGLAKLGTLKVQVPVSATMINSLRLGQRCVVQIGMGAATQEFAATLVTINPLPAKNLTYTVEVQFKNSENAMLVGQLAKVHFLSE